MGHLEFNMRNMASKVLDIILDDQWVAELGSNPLGTEPSVVVKRYTSGALAFQGSCMTICKLSNIFIN